MKGGAVMFYEFNQNNSGGDFDFDAKQGISHIVIVEADTLKSAVARAETIGLYFDGAGDCTCCGNRWYEPWEDGDTVPSTYGVPIEEAEAAILWMTPNPEGFVHYADGRVEEVFLTERKYPVGD